MDFLINKYSEEEEVRKVINKLDDYNWINISYYQKLSEDFIRQFQDKVHWRGISCHQKLSEEFIRQFKNKVDWFNICYNKDLQVSDKFCEEFDHKLCYDNIWRINGKYHRTLGPAIDDEFWYRGKKIEVPNIEQYKHWLKLRIFS
jgi:hypothetical protein